MAKAYKIEATDKGVRFSGTCTITEQPYEVTISTAQFREWREGGYIQEVCPELTADQREFLINRLTPAEFNDIFSAGEIVNKNVRMLQTTEGDALPTVHWFDDEDAVVEHLFSEYSSSDELTLTWAELRDILFHHGDTWLAPDNSVWVEMDVELPVEDHRRVQ